MTERDRFEAQVLVGCLRSKDFFEKVSGLLRMDSANPSRFFEAFSSPADNLIYRMIQLYWNRPVITGPDVVTYPYLQATAPIMAGIVGISPDLVPKGLSKGQKSCSRCPYWKRQSLRTSAIGWKNHVCRRARYLPRRHPRGLPRT